MRVVLYEVKDVGVVGVEQTEVVVGARLDGVVEVAFGRGAPGAQVTTAKNRAEVAPIGRLVGHLAPAFANLLKQNSEG